MALHALAKARHDQRKPAAADSALADAIALAESEAQPDTTSLIQMYVLRGNIARYIDKWDESERWLLRGLDLATRFHGEIHPTVAVAKLNLGNLYSQRGRSDDALKITEEGLAVAEQVYPPSHPTVAGGYTVRAYIHEMQRRWDEAVADREKSLALFRETLGPNHPKVASVLYGLASLYESAGNREMAMERAREAYALRREIHGANNADAARILAYIADLEAAGGQVEHADSLFRSAIAELEATIGAKAGPTATAYRNYARLLDATARLELADRYFRAAQEAMAATSGESDSHFGQCLVQHAYTTLRRGERAGAVEMMRKGLATLETALGADSLELAGSLVMCAAISAGAGDREGADALLARATRCGASPDEVERFPELSAARDASERRPPAESRPLANAGKR
jgi:tetratricopeptide (TPR) repeat protein